MYICIYVYMYVQLDPPKKRNLKTRMPVCDRDAALMSPNNGAGGNNPSCRSLPSPLSRQEPEYGWGIRLAVSHIPWLCKFCICPHHEPECVTCKYP